MVIAVSTIELLTKMYILLTHQFTLSLKQPHRSLIWAGFYALCIAYFVLVPLFKFFSRSSAFGKKIKCKVSGHKHDDDSSEIVTGWYELYDSLVDMLPAEPSWLSVGALYDLILLIPGSRWLNPLFLFKSHQAVKSQDQLGEAGTWVRMSEVQCLGGTYSEKYTQW